jgi:hypothetical protein
MQKCLIRAAFVEIEKGSRIFDFHPSIKKAGYGIVGFQMEIGTRNMVQAVKANPLFLPDEFISAGYAQPGKEKFSKIVQGGKTHTAKIYI